MRRAIGQKSSSSKEGDYVVTTARPLWAEKLLREVGDDHLLQFEARFADQISAYFSEKEYEQEQREAAYAHFLHQQISTHGGEVAAALRNELDRHAAETAQGMDAVVKRFGGDMARLNAEAGRVFQGIGTDLQTLRSQTEKEVGDIKSTTRAQEAEIKRVSAALSGAASETKAVAEELARQARAIAEAEASARRRAAANAEEAERLAKSIRDLRDSVEEEKRQAAAKQGELEMGQRALDRTVENLRSDIAASTARASEESRASTAKLSASIAAMASAFERIERRAQEAEQASSNEAHRAGDMAREALNTARSAEQGREHSQQRAEEALQEARAAASAVHNYRPQHQEQPSANPIDKDFFTNLASSIASGLQGKKSDEEKEKEDLLSENSDGEEDTMSRRMSKRLKRLKFIAASDRHFHAEAVFEMGPEKWTDAWAREFSDARTTALEVGARNPPHSVIQHNKKVEKLRVAAKILYNAAGDSQAHQAFKMLKAEAQEALCDLLAHQSFSNRRDTNCEALNDEIKKQSDTITRSTKTQKAVYLGELYRKAMKSEFQKTEDAAKTKRKNFKAPWGRGDHTTQSNAPPSGQATYNPSRGRGGGRGRGAPQPL
jgi:hypothetical protein